MQTFYMVIKKECLSIYEKNGNTYEMEEYNLDTIGEIDLIVIDNEDDIISNAMLEAFGDNVKQRISVEKLMLEILGRLEEIKNFVFLIMELILTVRNISSKITRL